MTRSVLLTVLAALMLSALASLVARWIPGPPIVDVVISVVVVLGGSGFVYSREHPDRS